MTCPECGSDTISKIEGSTLLIKCSCCDWAVATTYIDPINADTTMYTISLCSGNSPTKELLKTVSSITGLNYIAAKKLIMNPGSSLFQGKAPETKKIADALTEAGGHYKIKPDFKY